MILGNGQKQALFSANAHTLVPLLRKARIFILVKALVRDVHGDGLIRRHAVGHQSQRRDHAAKIDRVGRDLAVHGLCVQIKEQPHAAADVLLRRCRHIGAQQLANGEVRKAYDTLYPIRSYDPAYMLLVSNSQFYIQIYDVGAGPNPLNEN